ncbi:MAG: DMT family transporter [Gammaproteobacteria bacterium]
MNPFRGRAGAFAALGLLALIWGYNWVAMKVALEYAAPFPFAALRGIGGGIALLLLLALLRKPLRVRTPGWMILLGLTQTTGFAALTSLALATGSAGKAAILTYTMPFWVLLLAAPLLGERITLGRAIAGGLGLAGVVLIFAPWTARPAYLSSLFAVGAGLSWAAAVVIAKKTPVRGIWDLLNLNAWQSLVGGVPLAVIALLVPSPPIHWTVSFDLVLAYNIVLATSLAWFLWLFVLSRLSAGLSGLASLAVPVIGIVAAWLQLGERPMPWEGVGALVVIAGLAALAWNSGPKNRPRKA